MIRENGAMVLKATLVDRRNIKCDLVAPVVPTAFPVSSEAGDEEMSQETCQNVKHHKFQCWKEHVE